VIIINLPSLTVSGLALLYSIKTHDIHHATPVVITSNNKLSKEKEMEIYKHGAYHIIKAPFHPSKINKLKVKLTKRMTNQKIRKIILPLRVHVQTVL
jgi:DNA-binding NtrC family response regulator